VYKLKYFNDQVRLMMSKRYALWDIELEQELSPVLETLKEYGEVAGAICGRKPGISELVYELRGRTFQIAYTVNFVRKEVVFYEFHLVSHKIDWRSALEQDLRNGEEQVIYIPQIGDPHKLIRTIELISSGVNTAQKIGFAFGSGATNDKNLSRRGDYLGRAVIEFGLATKCKDSKQGKSIYVLTDRGWRIAQSTDLETRERLLAESLLGFYPIQMIIEETTRGDRELTKELIQEIISLVSLGDCGGTTRPRRASSLRALVNWVTRWAGIPVRREGNDGVQLYIPYIYASEAV
jgi:hypothetical protein